MLTSKRYIIFISCLITINSYSQPDSANVFYKQCNDTIETNFRIIALGSDTLKYFISTKYETHITFGNIVCYNADVIYPGLETKRNDVKTEKLAMYLIYQYNLNEVRIFKNCKVLRLAGMSIRPSDPEETKKIERYIQKNVKQYKRSITLN